MRAVDTRALDELGYVVLENFMPRGMLDGLREAVERLWTEEGDRAGWEFRPEPGARRLANLIDKGEVFRRLIAEPQILNLVGHLLGPRFKLSSLNARSGEPFSGPQPLHCDARAIADEQGYWVCNTVWLLDDFTADNGPTRIVPGSHRWNKLPQEMLADPNAPHPAEVRVLAPAGSVVVMNTHAWHGATANTTAERRRALHAFYCRWDKPQQQYQKQWLRAETVSALTSELRELLAIDDPLNDQLCAAGSGASGFLPPRMS